MTRWARRAFVITGIVVAVPAAMLVTDVAWRWTPRPSTIANRVAAAPDLDAYLTAREDSVAGIRPGLRKAIVWHDSATRERTAFSVVYLHGFSASRGELAPVPERLADSLGANLFVTRLTAHGLRDGEAFGAVSAQDWVDDAREAIAIGRRIGDRVIVLAMSTGVPLAVELALEAAAAGDSTAPAALILVSSNFGLADRRAPLAAGPFGHLVARLVVGRYRGFTPSNRAHDSLWTSRYRSEGITAMMDLIRHAARADLSRITVPVLTLYTRHDDVVDTALIRARHAAFGASVKEIVDLPAATRHEFASTALAPQAVAPAVDTMLAFTRRALGTPR